MMCIHPFIIRSTEKEEASEAPGILLPRFGTKGAFTSMKQNPQPAGRRSGRPNPAIAARNILGLIGRVVATFFLVCVITGCIVGSILTVYVLNYVAKDTTDIDLTQLETNSTLLLYAQNKESGDYYEMQRIYGDVNTIWISADKMPDHLFDVAIAAEDKRFMTHHGVDWKRTAGSFVNMFIPIYKNSSGGSTITQQVAKNLTGEAQVRVDRKIKEIFTGLNLENKYTKEQILEAYLNIAPFGGNIEGIQAAANYYFNKDAIDLTIPECAAIIATTQAPTGNSPIKNPENNKARRKYIFDTMLEMGTITEAQYTEFCNTDIVIDLNETVASKSNTYQTWFTDHVLEEVLEDLMAKYGYTYANASSILFNSGCRIYTRWMRRCRTISKKPSSTPMCCRLFTTRNTPRPRLSSLTPTARCWPWPAATARNPAIASLTVPPRHCGIPAPRSSLFRPICRRSKWIWSPGPR